MINIIGGKYKNTKLAVPQNDVRPTSSMKKKAIFSILESFALKNNSELYNNKCFVDLFAGTGSLGLEAISRGISLSYFFEINLNVKNILKTNCERICKDHQYKILHQEAETIYKISFIYPISVIFIDPPYKTNPFNNLLNQILKVKMVNYETIIIIETNKKKKIELPKKFSILKEKIYGQTKIIFLKKIILNTP